MISISDNLLIHAGTGTEMQAGDTRHHRASLLWGLFAADVVFFSAHRNDQVPIRIRRDFIAIRQHLHVRVDFDAVGIVRFPCICVPLFIVLNSYTTGLSSSVMTYLLQMTVGRKYKIRVDSQEIGLPVVTDCSKEAF